MDDMNLDERIARLERENHRLDRSNRRLKFGVLAVFGFAGAVLLMGQAASDNIPQVVRAHYFEVVNKDGKVAASMGLADGLPMLVLFDKGGTPRARMALEGDSVGLAFFDRNEKVRTVLAGRDNGPMAIAFYDRQGQARTTLGIDDKGSPSLQMYDENSNMQWSAPAEERKE